VALTNPRKCREEETLAILDLSSKSTRMVAYLDRGEQGGNPRLRPVPSDERGNLAHQIGPGDSAIDVRDDDTTVPLPEMDRGIDLARKAGFDSIRGLTRL
jgi:hypothetical protein